MVDVNYQPQLVSPSPRSSDSEQCDAEMEPDKDVLDRSSWWISLLLMVKTGKLSSWGW